MCLRIPNSKFRIPNCASFTTRIALDSRGGVAVAECAASLDVAGARAELRTVERLEQPAAANLARDRGQRVLRARRTRRGILGRVCDARAGAAVGIADEHAAGPVDSDVVEV